MSKIQKRIKFFLIFFIFFLSFLPKIFAQEYGMVLAGGGGKGAYEVGVWKALEEYGLSKKITVISGSSVGGLNAALFSCVSTEQAEELWKSMVPEELQNEEELISQSGLMRVLNQVTLETLQSAHFFPKVFITSVPAKNVIAKIATSWIFEPGVNARSFLLNEEKSVNEIKQKLLATSAFPIATKKVLLSDGEFYVDGGDEYRGGDNTPITPILDKYKPKVDFIITVYLDNHPKKVSNRAKVAKSFDRKKILEIIPSEDLGGIFNGTLNFSKEKITSLIDLGYNDTIRILEKSGLKKSKFNDFWYEE
ncbi:patatin-like phospholipase family protein [Treponema zioleckii]|uniref:patatin-like phospholipase family protein n=1 Tax=Treponema zioleckii TaxID=331680 RepID=UPI00168B9E2D|nr:patatin-like phospholipase family protein [Treponema zioleckii]